ncbi:MAG: hypothetical protein IPH09_10285 [bacterium]|nr:hypothetical protein [bacterium]
MLRKTILAMLLCLACGALLAAGCGPKAEAAKCADCGMAVPKDQATLVGGKLYCGHCAAAQSAKPAGEQHACAACGMTMGAADMVRQGDRWYCSCCVPAKAGADSTPPAAPAR